MFYCISNTPHPHKSTLSIQKCKNIRSHRLQFHTLHHGDMGQGDSCHALQQYEDGGDHLKPTIAVQYVGHLFFFSSWRFCLFFSLMIPFINVIQIMINIRPVPACIHDIDQLKRFGYFGHCLPLDIVLTGQFLSEYPFFNNCNYCIVCYVCLGFCKPCAK